MKPLACFLVATGLWCLAMAAGAQDFQPHPSHAPAPSSLPPSPAPRFSPPRKISGAAPEYPDRARLFNAQGSVLVKLTVDPGGKVQKEEILAGPLVYAESVLRAVTSWRFESRPETSEVRMRIPFTPGSGSAYAHDTAMRRMLYAPADPRELREELTHGFAYVRLLIDASGKVIDALEMSCEPRYFRNSWEVIAATLKFAPSSADPMQPRSTTVNEFLIDYANDGKIRVQQRGGE